MGLPSSVSTARSRGDAGQAARSSGKRRGRTRISECLRGAYLLPEEGADTATGRVVRGATYMVSSARGQGRDEAMHFSLLVGALDLRTRLRAHVRAATLMLVHVANGYIHARPSTHAHEHA